MTDLKAGLPLAMLAYIQRTGQAIEILKEILDDNIFKNLSKHNPFWNKSVEMDDLRMKFGYIRDKIEGVREIITIDPYEGNQ